MKLKSFLLMIVLLCSGLTGNKVHACGYYAPEFDLQMFHVTPEGGLDAYGLQISERLAQEWSQYIHGTLSLEDNQRLVSLTLEEVETLDHPVLNYARKNRDTEMLQYLRLLARYLTLANPSMDDWNYPTAEQLAEQKAQQEKLLTAIPAKVSSRLEARYQLLRMRLLFRMKRYMECIEFWQKTVKDTKPSVFRDMSRGFFAGALFRYGDHQKAALEYAELGDAYNAQFCVNNLNSTSSMRSVAEVNPNSPVLNYMLEKMMNNMEKLTSFVENPESEPYTSMYQVLSVRQKDMDELERLANDLLGNAQLQDKSMWKSAVAFVKFMQDKFDEAWTQINDACNLPGTEVSLMNSRSLRLLLVTALTDTKQVEQIFLKEADWIASLQQGEHRWLDNLGRIAALGVIPQYEKTTNKNMKLMSYLLQAYADDDRMHTNPNIPQTYTDFASQFENSTFVQMKNFYQFLFNEKVKHSDFEKKFIAMLAPSRESMEDMIGTRALREGKWEEAITWLSKVSNEFLSNQSIAPYAQLRDYHLEEWISAKKDVREYTQVNLTVNKKVEYCREMNNLRNSLMKASGEERCQIAYKMAVMYFQASVAGSCWWLTRYGKTNSLEYNDPDPEGCINMMTMACNMLRVSRFSTDRNLRAKSLFASLFIPVDRPYEWRYNENYQEVLVLNTSSKRYEDLMDLNRYRNTTPDCEPFITKCDVLNQVLKMI